MRSFSIQMSLVVGLKMQIASGKEILLPFVQLGRICYLLLNGGQNLAVFCFLFHPLELRPRLHGIRSKWGRIHLDPIHFLRGVYTGSDPELLAFTRDRIHLDFMNS